MAERNYKKKLNKCMVYYVESYKTMKAAGA